MKRPSDSSSMRSYGGDVTAARELTLAVSYRTARNGRSASPGSLVTSGMLDTAALLGHKWSRRTEAHMVQGADHSHDSQGAPAGGVYEWYQRGLELLNGGSPPAAIQLLEHAAAAEPSSRSVREALARAQYGAKRYAEAAESFRKIVEAEPTEAYALFGLGLALTRTGEVEEAV